jgi:hypothetical protein
VTTDSQPPTAPSTPPTTPSPTAVAFTVHPTTVAAGYSRANAPTLTWTVTGSQPVQVAVTGPGGFSSTSTSQAATPLCPDTGNAFTADQCPAPTGTYTYLIVVRAAGTVVSQQQATLTIGAG